MSDTPEQPRPASAAALRQRMLEKELEKARTQDAAREKERQARAAFAERFMTEHVTEQESALIRQLVLKAAADGKFEALVYSFPSDLCTDGGRAINNADPTWPDTLQGKARELYDRFMTVAQPEGYKLRASIINFPGGVPGDVGFFIGWEPEAV